MVNRTKETESSKQNALTFFNFNTGLLHGINDTHMVREDRKIKQMQKCNVIDV